MRQANWLIAAKQGWYILRRKTGDLGESAFLLVLVALSLLAALSIFVPMPLPSLVLGIFPFLLILARVSSRLVPLGIDLRNERACLAIFVENARTYWAGIQTQSGAGVTKKNVEDLVDRLHRDRAPLANKLIESIAGAQIDFISAPGDVIARPFRENLEFRFREVAGNANLSTRLGILGTFVGFISALFALGTLFAALGPGPGDGGSAGAGAGVEWDKLSPQIQSILNNLAFAFVTSLYGLGLAILIQLQVSGAQRSLEKVYKLFDEAVRYGREFVNRMTLSDSAIQTTLSLVAGRLRDVDQRLLSHAQSVDAALNEHGNRIDDEVRRFAEAAQGMVAVQHQWESAFAKLKEAAGEFDARTATMIGKVDQGLASAASELEQALRSLEAGQQELAIASANVSDTASATIRETDAQWRARLDELIAGNREQQKQYQEWSAQVSATLVGLTAQLQPVEAGLRELQTSLERTTTSLERALRRPIGVKNGIGRWLPITLLVLVILAAAVAVEIFLLGDPLDLGGRLRDFSAYIETLGRSLPIR